MASKPRATIVDLQSARSRRRLHDYDSRLREALDQNRGALSRLFGSGDVFTRRGTRTGRDLLLAHQHLLRVQVLLAKVAELGAGDDAERIYGELDALLEKTTRLTDRAQESVSHHRRR